MADVAMPAGIKGAVLDLSLDHRQEFSRTTAGITLVRDLGPPVWKGQYLSKPYKGTALEAYRADFDGLKGSLNTLLLPVQCWPAKNPRGAGITGDTSTAVVGLITAENDGFRIDGLAAGAVLSKGDKINVGPYVYRIKAVEPGDIVRVSPNVRPSNAVGNAVKYTDVILRCSIEVNALSTASGQDGFAPISFNFRETK